MVMKQDETVEKGRYRGQSAAHTGQAIQGSAGREGFREGACGVPMGAGSGSHDVQGILQGRTPVCARGGAHGLPRERKRC